MGTTLRTTDYQMSKRSVRPEERESRIMQTLVPPEAVVQAMEPAPSSGHVGSGQAARKPTAIIQPSHGWSALNVRELWHYRDLFLILAGRDVKLRYKQTALGVLWVILQPLIAAVLFAVIFGRVAKLPSNGLPYFLFAFSGMLPWTLFAAILQRGATSLVLDARLIAKVYFPRLLIPLASSGAAVVDFLVSLSVLFVLLPVYHVGLRWQMLAIPVILVFTLLGASGIAFCLAGLNVQYRDFAYILPFVLQIWLFITPVVYSSKLIAQHWQWVYSLNPAVAYVDGFRWALLGATPPPAGTFVTSACISIALFVGGAYLFRRIERGFADAI